MYEIGKIASKIILAANEHPTESRYISVAQIPNEWPFVFHDDMYIIERISIGNSNNLEDYILNSRNQLTHIIVDDNPDLPEFLQDVNKNEEKYQYLKKIFEIDYKQFDLMN